MSDVAEHSDTGTIVEWDAHEGVGVVRTDEHSRLVWIHFSMHASQGESFLWRPGVRVSIEYNATADQDGYFWVGERVVVLDHAARTQRAWVFTPRPHRGHLGRSRLRRPVRWAGS